MGLGEHVPEAAVSKHEEAAREIKAMILADLRDRPWEHTWDVADITDILGKHFPGSTNCMNCGASMFASIPLPDVIICSGCGVHWHKLEHPL